MKNIHKIAEDIFKAPSKEELLSRHQKISKPELVEIVRDGFMISGFQNFMKLFPNSAHLFLYYIDKELYDFVYDKINNLQAQWPWKFLRIPSKFDLYLMQVNGHKIIKADTGGKRPALIIEDLKALE